MSFLDSQEFIDRHPVSAKEFRKAQMRLAEGEVTDTLASVRNSFETILKDLCQTLNMKTANEDGNKSNHLLLIDLENDSVLSREEARILHRLRMLSNKGHHIDSQDPPTLDEAREGVELLAEALEIILSKFPYKNSRQQDFSSNSTLPRYYDPNRRYRGEWFHIKNREKLYENTNFANLSLKAEHGDVGAMLDIAIGFLPKNPVWGKEQIVCMPKYRDRNGVEYYNSQFDAVDARYYYWIAQACRRSLEDDPIIDETHKKYIPTAYLEIIKFAAHAQLGMLSGKYVSSVINGQPQYSDPYALAEEMFGKPPYVNLDAILSSFMSMIVEIDPAEAIDPLHQHGRYILDIYFLVMCARYNTDYNINITFDDEGRNYVGPVTLEVLEKLSVQTEHGDYYCNWIKQEQARKIAEEEARIKAEEDARIAEEQRAIQEEKNKAAAKKSAAKMRRLALIIIAVICLFKVYKWSTLEAIDPFESIQLKYYGAAPYGYAEIVNNSSFELVQDLDFTAADTTGLKNNDKITVKVNVSKREKKELEEYGYKIKDKSKTYTVSGLPEAVTKVKELDSDFISTLSEDTAETLEAHIFDSRVVEIYCSLTGSDEWWAYGYSGTLGDIENTEGHFLLTKNKDEGGDFNKLVMIFQCPTTIKASDDSILYDDLAYYAVTFTNLAADESGNIDMSAAVSTMEISDPVSSLDDAVFQHVKSYTHEYESSKLKNF